MRKQEIPNDYRNMNKLPDQIGIDDGEEDRNIKESIEGAGNGQSQQSKRTGTWILFACLVIIAGATTAGMLLSFSEPEPPETTIPASTPIPATTASISATNSASSSRALSSEAPAEVCDIDLSLSCEGLDGSGVEGVHCTEIPGEMQLTCMCPECVRELLFYYTDFSQTYMVCTSDDSIIFEGSVSTGTLVTMGNGIDCLSDDILCVFSNGDPGVTIDSSCDGPGIDLLDSYGSLEIIGYTCSEVDVHNCYIDTLDTIAACNTGSVGLYLAEMLFMRNGDIRDLIPLFSEDELFLEPQQCLNVFLPSITERCKTVEYRLLAAVDAETGGPGGQLCMDEEELAFSFEMGTPPPTPAPSPEPLSCNISLEHGCTVAGTDTDCSELQATPKVECICEQCPSQIIFRYVGFSLPNVVHIAIVGNDFLLKDERVSIGDDIIVVGLADGMCLPDEMEITFSDPATGDQFQQISVPTSCHGQITLLEQLGGVDFIGYTCLESPADQNVCFLPINYTIAAENIGFLDLSIIELDMTLNGETTDLIPNQDQADLVLSPGDSFQTNVIVEIELCTSAQYNASTSVTGTYPNSTSTCEDSDFFNINITTGSGFPSTSMSPTPSTEPT